MGSIRRRTLLLVLGLLGIALGGISFLGYRDARHEIQELSYLLRGDGGHRGQSVDAHPGRPRVHRELEDFT